MALSLPPFLRCGPQYQAVMSPGPAQARTFPWRTDGVGRSSAGRPGSGSLSINHGRWRRRRRSWRPTRGASRHRAGRRPPRGVRAALGVVTEVGRPGLEDRGRFAGQTDPRVTGVSLPRPPEATRSAGCHCRPPPPGHAALCPPGSPGRGCPRTGADPGGPKPLRPQRWRLSPSCA